MAHPVIFEVFPVTSKVDSSILEVVLVIFKDSLVIFEIVVFVLGRADATTHDSCNDRCMAYWTCATTVSTSSSDTLNPRVQAVLVPCVSAGNVYYSGLRRRDVLQADSACAVIWRSKWTRTSLDHAIDVGY